MPTQKSLVLLEKEAKPTVIDTEIPTPEAGELLVEIHATALNPIDWKMSVEPFFSSLLQSYPAVIGGDAAGIVKAIGEGVTQFAIGDKVYAYSTATCSNALTPVASFYEGFFTNKLSTFQQYGVIPADLAAKVRCRAEHIAWRPSLKRLRRFHRTSASIRPLPSQSL